MSGRGGARWTAGVIRWTGALRECEHADTCQSKQARSGEGRECGLEQAGLVVSGSVMVGSGSVMVGSWSDQLSAGWAVRSHVGPYWAEPVVKCAGSESGSKRRST